MQAEPSLLDLAPSASRSLLDEWVVQEGLPAWRAAQIHRRLWVAPVGSWSEASELPLSLRASLEQRWPLPVLTPDVVQQSTDGTRKYLWALADGERIESVLIPSGRRRTLCISSQAGCALGCVFCATGRMGFRRNLEAHEIAGQLRAIVLATPDDKPTNVVFMGMGEPLLNWPGVDATLSILNQPEGFGIGARHITVSTVGVIPGMLALARRPEQFRLAISVHSPFPEARLGLMPIQKKYPLEQVLEVAAREFPRRVTFEYVLISGLNDRDVDAQAIGDMARKLSAHVNLIPLHPGGAPGLAPTGPAAMRAFRDRLTERGIEAVIRRSRGLDIDAACGQLHVEQERRQRRDAIVSAPTA